MGIYASNYTQDFVLLLGDNFYKSGVQVCLSFCVNALHASPHPPQSRASRVSSIHACTELVGFVVEQYV